MPVKYKQVLSPDNGLLTKLNAILKLQQSEWNLISFYFDGKITQNFKLFDEVIRSCDRQVQIFSSFDASKVHVHLVFALYPT